MLEANDVVGPYTLSRKLGEGSFGEVWLARQSGGTPAEVALKFPKQVDLKVILKEADVWASVGDHPNVLPFLGSGSHSTRDGERVAIVSPFVADGSLADWLHRHGGKSPAPEQAVEIMCGVLDGLTHLASKNVVHRDLKPANVLMDGMRPMLADFGVARILGASLQSSVIAGTELYMAPEAFDGRRSHQTDVWSAAVLFYQLLAGKLPFQSVLGICTREAEPLPRSVPERLREVVAQALRKAPEERYLSAAELKTDLQETVRRPNTPVPSSGPARPPTIRNGLCSACGSPQAFGTEANKTLDGLPESCWHCGVKFERPPLQVSFVNSIGTEFVLIPAGSFLMGSETGRDSEKPVHRVTIGRPFYLGKFLVTQAQWRTVMKDNPGPSSFRGADFPVDQVSWNDVREFIGRLNEKEGTDTYRLPSEAEWEYACRAGTTGEYAGELRATAWYRSNSFGRPRPVGLKRPNNWGLHDMHGNLWEWCDDVWHDTYKGAPTDGSAWTQGGDQHLRILRGGSWSNEANRCRAAYRYKYSTDGRDLINGFRLVAASGSGTG